MKGLLFKDLFLMRKTIWVYLLMVVIFAVTQGQAGLVFTLFYSITIPITLINYDEVDHFDRMQTVMPVRGVALVLDKYVCAWAAIAFVAVCFFARGLFPGEPAGTPAIVFGVAASLIVQATLLPMMYRFGIERGRTIYVVVLMALGVLLGAVSSLWEHAVFAVPDAAALILLAVAALASAASVPLSAKLYADRYLS